MDTRAGSCLSGNRVVSLIISVVVPRTGVLFQHPDERIRVERLQLLELEVELGVLRLVGVRRVLLLGDILGDRGRLRRRTLVQGSAMQRPGSLPKGLQRARLLHQRELILHRRCELLGLLLVVARLEIQGVVALALECLGLTEEVAVDWTIVVEVIRPLLISRRLSCEVTTTEPKHRRDERIR